MIQETFQSNIMGGPYAHSDSNKPIAKEKNVKVRSGKYEGQLKSLSITHTHTHVLIKKL